MEAKPDIAKRLDTAWKYLNSIPVSGDAVDVMFAAKQEIRAAYAALTKETEEQTNGR